VGRLLAAEGSLAVGAPLADIGAEQARAGPGARLGGRKNVAHGGSRGEKAGPKQLESPGRGDRAALIIADLLSPPRGPGCFLCAAITGSKAKKSAACHPGRGNCRPFAALRVTANGSGRQTSIFTQVLAPLLRLEVGQRGYSSAHAPCGCTGRRAGWPQGPPLHLATPAGQRARGTRVWRATRPRCRGGGWR